MFKSNLLKLTAAFLIIAVTFAACKKDPFTEKDAIAAQSTLLQQKYSYDLQIAQISAAASRSHDSALIVIQTLQNSGASALAVLQAQQNMAYLMQQYQNNVAIYKLQDSIAKGTAATSQNNSIALQKFYDSLQAARNNATAMANLKKNYSFKVTDLTTSKAISGAIVSAFSYVTNSIITATTDANGVAMFTGAIFDPSAYYYVNSNGYAFSSGLINTTTFTPQLWNTANASNTVNGQITADLDLTNGSIVEGVAGQLVTFSTYNPGSQQNFQFPITTDVNGNYSIKLPDNIYSYTVNTSGTITANQKMFVRYFQGNENPTTSIPRIDSVSTTLSLNTTYAQTFSNGGLSNTVSVPSFFGPNVSAFYISLPKDTLGNNVIIAQQFTSQYFGFGSVLATGALKSTQTDSLNFLNLSPSLITNQKYNYRIHPYDATNDVLTCTLVDLTGNILKNSPSILATVDRNTGKIINFTFAAPSPYPLLGQPTYSATQAPFVGGMYGLFVNRWDNYSRVLDGNMVGNRPYSFTQNVRNNNSSVALQGGITTTINFDYIYNGSFFNRAKSPQ